MQELNFGLACPLCIESPMQELFDQNLKLALRSLSHCPPFTHF